MGNLLRAGLWGRRASGGACRLTISTTERLPDSEVQPVAPAPRLLDELVGDARRGPELGVLAVSPARRDIDLRAGAPGGRIECRACGSRRTFHARALRRGGFAVRRLKAAKEGAGQGAPAGVGEDSRRSSAKRYRLDLSGGERAGCSPVPNPRPREDQCPGRGSCRIAPRRRRQSTAQPPEGPPLEGQPTRSGPPGDDSLFAATEGTAPHHVKDERR